MSLSWTSSVMASIHNAKLNGILIEHREIAAKIGWTPEYLSMVLNGKRTPPDAENKVRAALDQLISERST